MESVAPVRVPYIFFLTSTNPRSKGNLKGKKFERKFERKILEILRENFVSSKKNPGQGNFELSLQILRFQFALKEYIYGFEIKILLFNDNKIR